MSLLLSCSFICASRNFSLRPNLFHLSLMLSDRPSSSSDVGLPLLISAKRKTIEILSDQSLHLHTDGIRHAHVTWSPCFMAHTQEGEGGARLSKTSYTYDPLIYDITSGLQSCCSVLARNTKMDARCYLVSSSYFHPQLGKGNYVS